MPPRSVTHGNSNRPIGIDFHAKCRIFDSLFKRGLTNLLVTAYRVDKPPEGNDTPSLKRRLAGAMRVGSATTQKDLNQFEHPTPPL